MSTPPPLPLRLSTVFRQGQDAVVKLKIKAPTPESPTGVELMDGDTIQAQLRKTLISDVLYDMGLDAEIVGQDVTLKIPGAESKTWPATHATFVLSSTVLIIGAQGQHRLALPLELLWQASHTRGGS
ncbi:hypothetical protein GO986_09125 [Deinococcus sp. HMF7620]|uniref:Uncharacterized protein n=1 Tax=Deinococcus arboris TaxID=2682977 RepID=A0A7C9IAR4_9DEIO|nr:hypothetical protein [Deinococcus arboris]MVN86926.1 hypothetical protein [Deinococcus arboris]